jgi:hypothetical protein
MAFVIFGTVFFSPLEAIGKYKKKMEVIKNHGRSHENVKQRLEAAESKRSNGEDFGVPESTLSKSADFSRPLQGYVFK